MGKSNNGVFLNAAAGLLRHLAIPLTNRETLFGQGNHLRNVAQLYADDSLEQVQIAGLQLTRQVITGMPQRAQGLIDGGGENGYVLRARASIPVLRRGILLTWVQCTNSGHDYRSFHTDIQRSNKARSRTINCHTAAESTVAQPLRGP